MAKSVGEIEKIFHQENREKKRTGNGIHSRTGTRGYVGKMLFPADIMSRKDKYNYRKNGKVVTYKMNEMILPKEQFDQKDEETQRLLLTRWRELYSNKEIMESMGVRGNAAFHNLITGLNIPKKRTRAATESKKRGGARKGAGRRKAVETKQGALILQEEQQPPQQQPLIIQQVQPQIEVVKNGLNLEYMGEYTAEQLTKILTKLQLIVEGEPNKYQIKISLKEREEVGNL